MFEKPKSITGARNLFESKEGREIFRATLGFDFIFRKDEYGRLQCFCLEINGDNTGIRGVQEIEKGMMDITHKTMADIRMELDPEFDRKRKVFHEILDMDYGKLNVTEEAKPKVRDYLRRSLSSGKMFRQSHKNPAFINTITGDKNLQEKYIPEYARPRQWHQGESTRSETGLWVVKPRKGVAGRGVRIVRDRDLSHWLDDIGKDVDKFVIQEFIESAGAQNDENNYEHSRVANYPASMRLLIDFRYFDTGRVEPEFISFYQRVSPYGLDDVVNRIVYADNALLVNKDSGARSVAASDEEYRLAKPVAEAIIKNIAEDYIRQDTERHKNQDS